MSDAARKYAMTKLSRGDYLLPSNDAKWLWRIYTYDEHGSLADSLPDGTERAVVGTFWACARRPLPAEGTRLSDLLEWDGWEFWAAPLPSRQAAIEEALRVSRGHALRASL